MVEQPHKNIAIKKETWRKLHKLRVDMEFRNLDEVVAWLIEFYEKHSGRTSGGD